ncbi:uncharacterized protein VTP21DRAFT_8674 [Calcarisporiella thermophila]|uniref:uncharacterized protein n=1 Tax=Calcarisporiella thermophila TaxID=911321 RepID=UPI003743E6A8
MNLSSYKDPYPNPSASDARRPPMPQPRLIIPTQNTNPIHSRPGIGPIFKDIVNSLPKPSPSPTPGKQAANHGDNESLNQRDILVSSKQELEVLQKLGEGAASTVHLVRHLPSGVLMAKKSIVAEFFDTDVRRQVIREVQFLSRFESPYIVSYYGAYYDDPVDSIVICTEYCAGGSLEAIYRQSAKQGLYISEGVLGKIAEAVLSGLDYLHEQCKIHRDIKPSNIVVTKKGEIKLCDFGVSGELVNSIAETFLGTRYYMAPERIRNDPYSIQSDVWSLGLTLLEVAQMKPLHPPNMPIFELVTWIQDAPMPELPGDRTEEARDFVRVCLTKDPRSRPSPGLLLGHPWVRKWVDQEVDLARWIADVWGWNY